MLTHSELELRESAVEVISSIAQYGNHLQIQAIIDANMIPTLVSMLSEGESSVGIEAVWIIEYLTMNASPDQIFRLLECNVLEPMCDLLTIQNTELLKALVVSLKNIVKVWIL